MHVPRLLLLVVLMGTLALAAPRAAHAQLRMPRVASPGYAPAPELLSWYQARRVPLQRVQKHAEPGDGERDDGAFDVPPAWILLTGSLAYYAGGVGGGLLLYGLSPRARVDSTGPTAIGITAVALGASVGTGTFVHLANGRQGHLGAAIGGALVTQAVFIGGALVLYGIGHLVGGPRLGRAVLDRVGPVGLGFAPLTVIATSYADHYTTPR
jgi:hypothetical protein